MDDLCKHLDAAFSEFFPVRDIEVSQCSAESVGDVMSFIDRHWKSGHILSTDRELFDFMHLDDGRYHYSVGKTAEDVSGILGYIPTSQYDRDLEFDGDVWLAIWKSIGCPGSGLRLLMPIAEKATTIASIGINAHVAKVYRWLGFDISRLTQLYLLNDTLPDFQIAKATPVKSAVKDAGDVTLVEWNEAEVESHELRSCWRPRKTARYVINRYLKHPIYQYQVLGVREESGNQRNCVFVVRKISVGNASCLRLVDIVGDLSGSPFLRCAWQRYLRENNLEFVDCLQSGLTESEMERLGFDELDPSGDTIVPNYFEPFERRNVVITTALNNPTGERYVMFKGDSDQDRPNRR